MKTFVFWTGVYDILLGAGFFIPQLPDLLGIKEPQSNFYTLLPATLIVYLGILLIISSRDLEARAPIVYWEGILRIAGFVLAAGYGFLGNLGAVLGWIGVLDLLIGLVYLIGLPRYLKLPASAILLDKR